MKDRRASALLRGMVCSFITLFLSLSLTTPGRASDDPRSRATLQGVTGLQVVADVDATIVKGNPALKELLQQESAEQLREAGIAVTSSAHDCLHVAIHAHDLLIGYAFAIQVDLDQLVQLVREERMATLAPTWGIGGMGTIPDLGPESMAFLRQSVADAVGQFIEVYREENPITGERKF